VKLITLKPRLSALVTQRIPTQAGPTGMTERPRGRAWMATRDRVAKAHGYRCSGCNCTWSPVHDKIDHTVPRWKGGSDEDSNLQPLCAECHGAKTKAEAAERARGY
jgi:5-methylcytosine-specific restriction protein A